MAIGIERRGGKDRRVAWHYRFHDRRTGFDRRKHPVILEVLRDSTWALIGLLVLLNVLSLLDGVFTYAELSTGIAREGNPLFRGLIGASPLFAAGFKIVMMIVISVVLWLSRHHRVMLMLTLVTLVLYAAVLGYHLGSLSGFLSR